MSLKLRNILKLASKICAIVFTFVFGVFMVGGIILFENEDAVNTVLNAKTQEIVQDESDADKDKEYYKSAFGSVAEVKANGEVYGETVVAEGATLLKNNNALPLKAGAGVSLFSVSSTNPVISGTGSSGSIANFVTLKTGLEEAGLKVNADLYDWYEDNQAAYGRKKSGGTVGTVWTIGDAKWNQISTTAKIDPTYGDAAIFVLSRSGGEGIDSTIYGGDKSDFGDGNYLKLSPSETDVLKNLKLQKDAGVFKKIIVLMNSSNPVECAFADDAQYGIDALLWVGTYGEVGAYAIGDILTGNVNPSGRLSDTFWKYHYLNPVHANYATLVDESNSVTQWTITRTASSGKNIVYQEGIYMGYRYAETRYEDTVLKDKENVGDFVYGDVISYPFGYGLSYTKFSYSDMKAEKTYKSAANKLKDNIYTVSVKVTNNGSVAGKETVQIYLQKPYTQYDIENGIEKASVELVGFGKTGLLEPNASEVVNVTFSEREFASYDSNKAKTYIVDGGKYYITAGKDAHDAVNNVLAAKGKNVSDGMTAAGNADLVWEYDMSFDDKTYSKSAVTSAEITNRFDDADLKRYEGAGANADSFEYVTRSNWAGTVKFGLTADNERTHEQVMVTATDKMQQDLDKSWNPKAGEGNEEYPTYGSTKTSYALIDLRAYGDDDNNPTNDKWIPYDDPMWDDLLDQLTWEDTVALLSAGLRKTAAVDSIAKPETIDHNGATGPVERYNVNSNNNVNRGYAVRTDDERKSERPVVYPCNGLAASTFNLTLADYYGRQWGEDCLWAGYSGLYGMGMNTHRSAYGGRNFEYYSEDPVLMGQIAAQMTKGMATRGTYVYLKHCFLNDQETYRCGGWTWANEQTIREVYMKSFQIAIEDGGAQCVMGGLNSIGMMWTGVHGFMNTVLRGEFGMTGHVVTDSYSCYNGSFVRGVYYGNDIPDGTVNTGNENFNYVKDGGYSEMAWAMRESAHRVLYTVVHSNAMNDFSAGTRVIKLTPWWKPLVTGLQVSFGILFGVSIASLAAMLALEYIDKAKGRKQI